MSCCCDADPCVLCSDNFNRSDSSDIDTGSSCGWTERSGAWEILSNRLRSTSSGVATTDTLQPGAQGNYISVTIWGDTAGDTAQVVVNLDHNAGTPLDNYDYVEVTFSATVGQIRIMEIVGGGAPNQLAATTANLNIALSTDHTLLVCLRDGDIAAALTHGGTTTYLNTELDGDEDTSVGLGSSTSGNVEFDDWSFERNKNQNSECNDCGASCLTACTNCITDATDQYLLEVRNIKEEGGGEPGIDPIFNFQCSNCRANLNENVIVTLTSGCTFDFTYINDPPCRATGAATIQLRLDQTPADSIRIHLTYNVTTNRTCTVTFQTVVTGGYDCLNPFESTRVPFLEDDGNCTSGCDFSDAFVWITPLPCQ